MCYLWYKTLTKETVEQGTSCEVVKYSMTTPTPHSCRSWPLDSPVCPKLPGSVTQGLPFTTAQYLRETKTLQPRPCSALMRYVWSARDPCHRTASPEEWTPKAVLTQVILRAPDGDLREEYVLCSSLNSRYTFPYSTNSQHEVVSLFISTTS